MTLPLTSETLARAYDYLRSTPPFSRWNLPEPEDVIFKVGRRPDLRGWYQIVGRGKKSRHSITISNRAIGHTASLLATMAHEMIHLHEQHACMASKSAHGGAFKTLAAQVCKVHGFDPKLF